MAADPREQLVMGGFAITGVTSAQDQSIITTGYSARKLIHALLAFAAATRHWLFERARR